MCLLSDICINSKSLQNLSIVLDQKEFLSRSLDKINDSLKGLSFWGIQIKQIANIKESISVYLDEMGLISQIWTLTQTSRRWNSFIIGTELQIFLLEQIKVPFQLWKIFGEAL